MATATLGFEIISDKAQVAKDRLEAMSGAAGKAEKAADGLGNASRRADAAIGHLGAESAKATGSANALANAEDMVAAAQNRATTATKAGNVVLLEHARAARLARNNSRQLSFQLIDIGQTIPLAFQSPLYALQNVGFQVAQIGQLYMGQGGLNQAIKDSGRQLGRFVSGAVTKFPLVTAAIAAAGVALVGMQHEINATGGVAVSMTDVLVGNFEVIKGGIMAATSAIYDFFQPAINAIAPWFASAWGTIVSGFKTVNNALIAGWVTAYDTIKTVWNDFPSVMGDLAYLAGDAFLNGLNVILDAAVKAVKNFYLTFLNPVAGAAKALGYDELSKWTGGNLFDGFKANLSMGDNPNAGAASKAGGDILGSAKDNFVTDYLGQYFDAVSKAAQANAQLTKEAESAGKAVKGAAEKAIDPWNGLRGTVEKVASSLQTAGQSAGGILKGLIAGTLDWRDALSQALSTALSLMKSLNPNFLGGGFFQGLLGGLLGFSKGGAFAGGNVIPFANGGVVNKPTIFPMANGAGLMGEAGPEAIMPLRRGPDGRLGVAAANSNTQPLRIELVSRFDADGGFQTAVERSSRPVAQQESALAAGQLARAVPAMVDARTDERQTRRIRPRAA